MTEARTIEADGAAPAVTVPLTVDLDGTLSRTDTLHEALLRLAARAPFDLLNVQAELKNGREAFKRAVADRVVVPREDLCLDDDVIAHVQAARADGRKTILISASDHRQVEAAVDGLDLFDEVIGTGSEGTEGQNLKGDAKAAYLEGRFGAGGFDYIGDAEVDAPVWAVAREAITARADARIKEIAEGANVNTRHIGMPRTRAGLADAVVRALRPRQWVKNLLIFLPMAAAHSMESLLAVVAAFLAFSMTASSVYVVNDLLDLSADRAHPRKRFRPFAAGEVTATQGLAVAAGLILGALALSLALTPPAFLAWLGIYYVATFAYSAWLKRKLIVDVMTLAGLYTVRIIAGAAAATVVLSPWMLGFSMFLFLALAAIKRQAELVDLFKSDKSAAAGRAYEADDLPVLRGIALSSSHAAVLVLSLYITSDAVQPLYDRPQLLWIVAPLLLYWLIRMVMKTHRGHMTDDPIVFAARDKTSLAVIAASGLAVLAAAVL